MSERLGWDYDYLLSKVKNTFRYVRSGILINSITEDENALLDTPYENLWNLRVKSISIDTPNRDMVVLLGKYTSKFVKESTNYFALLFEDYHGEAPNSILVVDVPDGREQELITLIDEMLSWYNSNRQEIIREKSKVLADILDQIPPEQAKELLKTIITTLDKASHK